MSGAGKLHPIDIATREIADIFGRMGFSVAHGPELEDDWHNFTALNVPEDHPARDMQDTFWVRDPKSARFPLGDNGDSVRPVTEDESLDVLRTHATSVTARELEKMAKNGVKEKRMIIPGKVFRNEATDATHEAQFYQIDGFAVGPVGTVTLAHLKGTLERFYREYLGPASQVRFRPSFFGFTEPSVEVDAWFEAPGKDGKAAGSLTRGKWLEMNGGGMLHPDVLKAAGLDPEAVAGFAFGGGMERLLMVKHGVDDVRHFHNGAASFAHSFS